MPFNLDYSKCIRACLKNVFNHKGLKVRTKNNKHNY